MFCVSSTDDNHGRRRPRAQGPLSLKQLIVPDDKPLILGETSPYMVTRSQISERLLSRDYPKKAIKIQNHYPASKFQSEAPHPRAEYCHLDLICILPALMVILRGTPSHKHKISLTITYQRLLKNMSIYNRIPQLYSRKITFHKKLREVIFQRKHASKLHYIKTLFFFFYLCFVIICLDGHYFSFSFLFVFLVNSSYMTSKFNIHYKFIK